MDGGRDGKNGVSASFSYEELYGVSRCSVAVDASGRPPPLTNAFTSATVLQAVMDVCMHKAGDKLYTQLRNEFGDRAEKLVAGVEASVEVRTRRRVRSALLEPTCCCDTVEMILNVNDCRRANSHAYCRTTLHCWLLLSVCGPCIALK